MINNQYKEGNFSSGVGSQLYDPLNENKTLISNFENLHINEFQTFPQNSELILNPEVNKIKRKHIVLNVDDNYLNLIVINRVCQYLDLEVVEAKNGLEAITEVENLLQKRKIAFDLIFMDCDMPYLDGFEASKRINEIYWENNMFQTGILAIHYANDEEILMKCYENGIKEIVLKPLNISNFIELISKYLNI